MIDGLKTPEQIKALQQEEAKSVFYKNLNSSSLFRIVSDLETSKIAFPQNPSGLVLPDEVPLSPVSKDVMRNTAALLLLSDPEFQEMERILIGEEDKIGGSFYSKVQQDSAKAVLGALLDFYIGDTDIQSKKFLAMPEVRGEITRTGKDGIGHFFIKTLEGISQGGLDLIDFANKNLEYIILLDQAHIGLLGRADYQSLGDLWLMTQKNPTSWLKKHINAVAGYQNESLSALYEYRSVFEEILDTAFNIADSSKWRQFILSNFPQLFASLCFYGHPKDYHGLSELEGLKELVERTEARNLDTLGLYIGSSRLTLSDKYKEIVDNDIKKGSLAKAEALIEFGKLMSKLRPDITDTQRVSQCWVERFIEGKVTLLELVRVPLVITSLLISENSFLEKHPELKNKSPLLNDRIISLFTDRRIAASPNEIISLLNAGIFPTDKLITFIKEENEALSKLEEFQQQTAIGQLDPTSPIQKDLEFTKYLFHSPDLGLDTSYEQFTMLPFSETKPGGLPYSFTLEADATAYEAGNLYQLAKKIVDSGRRLHVVGNDRFGATFYVDPLRDELQQLGVDISVYRAPSSNTNWNSTANALSARFLVERVMRGEDLMIVDGSKQPEAINDQGVKIDRLPSAQLRYLNNLLAFIQATGANCPIELRRHLNHLNSLPDDSEFKQVLSNMISQLDKSLDSINFRFAHWLPDAHATSITYGNLVDADYQPVDLGFDGTQVIFANPVINPERSSILPAAFKDHTIGFWDDYNNHLKGKVFELTPYGLQWTLSGVTEAQLAELAATRIHSRLPQVIRELGSNPKCR